MTEDEEKATMLQALMHAQYDAYTEANPGMTPKATYNQGWIDGFEFGTELAVKPTVRACSEMALTGWQTAADFAGTLADTFCDIATTAPVQYADGFRQVGEQWRTTAKELLARCKQLELDGVTE